MSTTLALITAIVAWLSLGAQALVTHDALGGPGGLAVIWAMGGYFTVLTNLWVAVALTCAASGRAVSARMAAAMTLSIALVGIVYHAVLARLWAPVGLELTADQGMHSVVPALTAVWWVVAVPKTGLGLRNVPTLLAWPVGYLGYALVRQMATGFVPYPFLDISALGPLGVAKSVLTMLGLSVAIGAVMIAIARVRRR